MVYDCFIFWNELDILKLRLHTLDNVVDRFVLVESDRDHSGHSKPLHFKENQNRFVEFLHKIEYVVVRDMPDNCSRLDREVHQRNAIMRGLDDADIGDLILISDADEIPNPERVTARATGGYKQQMFYYYYNLLTGYDWVGTAALQYADLKKTTPQKAREAVRSGGMPVIQGGGWHFSWIGDLSYMSAKLAAFSHSELDNDAIRLALPRLTGSLKDFAGRNDAVFTPLELEAGVFPAYLVERQCDFKYVYPTTKALQEAWHSLALNPADENLSLAYEGMQSKILARDATNEPLVDVIILSWSKDRTHYEYTCRCVASFVRSSPEIPINIVVVETNPDLESECFSDTVLFRHPVTTIFPKESFGYNRFLRIAYDSLVASKAKYLMVLNNDVVAFCLGFVKKMLEAAEFAPVVTPVGLRERMRKPSGADGVHVSADLFYFEGFCVLIHKNIFNRAIFTDYFPPQLSFYFQDNYFFDKLISLNIKHASARDAECLHLGWKSQDLLEGDRKTLLLGGEEATYKELLKNMNEKTQRIILVTMVRNERKIIARMLESALPVVDAVVVVDTGSTDDTIAVATDTVGERATLMVAVDSRMLTNSPSRPGTISPPCFVATAWPDTNRTFRPAATKRWRLAENAATTWAGRAPTAGCCCSMAITSLSWPMV